MKDQFILVTLSLLCLASLSIAEVDHFSDEDSLNDHHRNPCHGSLIRRKVPNRNNCAAFYECVLSVPIPRRCNAGKIFDEAQSKCVVGNQETCEIYVPTTEPPPTTTTEATTTTRRPLPDLDAICQGIFFAARPYPDNDKIFVGCIREKPLLMSCREDEVFNQDINECVSLETAFSF